MTLTRVALAATNDAFNIYTNNHNRLLVLLNNQVVQVHMLRASIMQIVCSPNNYYVLVLMATQQCALLYVNPDGLLSSPIYLPKTVFWVSCIGLSNNVAYVAGSNIIAYDLKTAQIVATPVLRDDAINAATTATYCDSVLTLSLHDHVKAKWNILTYVQTSNDYIFARDKKFRWCVVDRISNRPIYKFPTETTQLVSFPSIIVTIHNEKLEFVYYDMWDLKGHIVLGMFYCPYLAPELWEHIALF